MIFYTRVISCQEEVEQQADGLLHIDLVCGGQTLVQLVKDGGQHHFQTSHRQLSAEVHVVEAVLTERLDDVPNINQMH